MEIRRFVESERVRWAALVWGGCCEVQLVVSVLCIWEIEIKDVKKENFAMVIHTFLWNIEAVSFAINIYHFTAHQPHLSSALHPSTGPVTADTADTKQDSIPCLILLF